MASSPASSRWMMPGAWRCRRFGLGQVGGHQVAAGSAEADAPAHGARHRRDVPGRRQHPGLAGAAPGSRHRTLGRVAGPASSVSPPPCSMPLVCIAGGALASAHGALRAEFVNWLVEAGHEQGATLVRKNGSASGCGSLPFIFASFLIGLGGTINANLPRSSSAIPWKISSTSRQPTGLRGELRRATGKAAGGAGCQRSGTTETQRCPRQFIGGAIPSTTGWRPATPPGARRTANLIERTQALDELKMIERKALADVGGSSRPCLMPARPKRGRSAICRELQASPPREN